MDPESELLGDDPVRLLREPDPPPGASPRRRSGHLRWWWVFALVLVVGGGAIALVDSRAREREGVAVAGCERHLQVATGYAERTLGLVSNYLQPTLTTGGRVQQLHLADLMSQRAGTVLPRVQRADRICRAVAVRPWHFSLVARHGDATAYSAALVTLIQIVAAQGRAPFRDDATLQRLRAAVGIGGG
jgi:hypothetical protein